MSETCDPASDDWTANFVFTKDDGYLCVEWFPTTDEYSDNGQLVAFVDAGDGVFGLLQKMREFVPAPTDGQDNENNAEDKDEDSG